jgi:hypothetical protein
MEAEKSKVSYLVIDGTNKHTYPTKKALQSAFKANLHSSNAVIWKGRQVQIVTETIQQITVK